MLPPDECPRRMSTGRPIKGTLRASFGYAWEGLVYTCSASATLESTLRWPVSSSSSAYGWACPLSNGA